MREIIHIQAGSLSNYTGTHFWNTQESYFTYGEDDTSIADYSISFAEGRDEHNQPTLYPRLLAFDQKPNFGTLTRDPHRGEALTMPTTWHGGLVHQEQDRIPPGEYHSHPDLQDSNAQSNHIATNVRYWSDFSRVFFDPKSIQAIPDALGIVEGDWSASCDAFSQHDNNTELMDGSLRLLVEDCNNLQGIQMIQDTLIFGGFSNCLLSAFREEYPKATIMAFTCLSNVTPHNANLQDSKQILNDALSLRSTAEFCDLSVPILSPLLWEGNYWFSGYNIDNKSLYPSSAILSTHIETATLPLRLRGGLDDLQAVVAHLNWRSSSRFAMLGGMLVSQGVSTQNFQDIASLSGHSSSHMPFARRDVSRGFSEDEMAAFDAWSKAYELNEPFLTRHHLPSYPIPTSFPQIFPGTRPKALKVISSLSTSPSMGGQLVSYARFVHGVAKRRGGALSAMALEEDEVRELIDALWDTADE